MRFPLPFRKKRSLDPADASPNQAPWADFWYNMASETTVGGLRVSRRTADRLAAYQACKAAISESISMLPCVLMNEVDETKKVKDVNHPLYSLLRDSPNPNMDSFTFFETMQDSACDTGNALAHIQRTKSGRILQLAPLLREKMEFKVLSNNSLGYIYRNEDGSRSEYTSKDIFHLRYKSRDGLIGRSPIETAPDVFALALSMQMHANSTFENGAFQSGMIKVPFDFKDDEARSNFIKSFKSLFGAKNAGKTGVLEQGADWVKIAQDNIAAQLLGLRQESVLDMCRLMRVPPVFAQVMDKGMAFASVEQFAILLIQYTLQPWAVRWERAVKYQLLGGSGDADRFVRFNLNALLRGDLASRITAVVAALGAGLKTINEGRHMLDDNRSDDPIADKLLLSNNLRPADAAAAAPGPVDNPATDPAPDEEVPNSEADTGERSSRESVEPLFESLMVRLVRREHEQLKTAAAKRADFAKWADEFYPKHRELMRETLAPACNVVTSTYQAELDTFLDRLLAARRSDFTSGTAEEIVGRIKSDATDWKKELLDAMEN